MRQEKFVIRCPKDPFLRNYIAHYYFHHCSEETQKKEFIFYPGFKNALTIYKKSRVEFGANYSRVEPDQESDFIFIYSGMQTHPRVAHMIAPFDKIGIVFKELGINHFIREPLSNISNHPIDKSFNYFGGDLIKVWESIYNKEDIDEKTHLIDFFFASQFCDFRERILQQCVQYIIHASERPTVESLSREFNITRKTLLRLFKKHLLCSIKDFIEVVQFRKSLDDYLLRNNNNSLTGLALEHGYYDHSQFIYHFRKLAGSNPKEFFRNVKKLGNVDIFWSFIK